MLFSTLVNEVASADVSLFEEADKERATNPKLEEKRVLLEIYS